MNIFLTLSRRVYEILSRNEIVERLKDMDSRITQWAERQEADLTEIQATLDGIATGVVELDKAIANLQNSPGAVTVADQVLLDRIQALSKSLVTKANDIRVDVVDQPQPPQTPPAA